MRFVCWLWRGHDFWKRVARYDPRHVVTLAAMLQRNGGHSLTCVHDGNLKFPAPIETIVMPPAVAALPDYLPKLWAWSGEFHGLIGERFASIDLDTVITGDLKPIVDTADKLRIWRGVWEHYNTSLFALEPFNHTDIWARLAPHELKKARHNAAYWTGDQSWVSYCLGPGAPTFGEADGVIQYRPSLHRLNKPRGMRVAFMCGPYEPIAEAEVSPWVRQAYR